METAGKQIFSMQRYIQDLEVRLGELFGPALQKMVFDLVDQFKAMSNALDNMQKSGHLLSIMNGLRDTVGSVINPVVAFTKAVWDHRKEILLLAAAYASIRLGVTISGWVTAMNEWVAAQKVALAAMASYNAATGEMAMASTAATVATKGMAAGVAALGGPIGILIALLGTATVAFLMFRDKTSEDAKKAGANIEAETAALQKKIEKQKAYWALVASGASAADAAKGLRATADDDPGIKDLDAKYGALQARLMKNEADWNAAWIASHAKTGFLDGESMVSPQVLDLQRQMNDLLDKRQKFVELFNQAQHGSDLVEEHQMQSAKEHALAIQDQVKSAGDLYETNRRLYLLSRSRGGDGWAVGEARALPSEKTIRADLLAPAVEKTTFNFQKLEDTTTTLMRELRDAAESGDTFAIMGYTVATSAANAADALTRWSTNVDGLGVSWTTLGATVRNVIADMLRQMERVILQQQLMDPLLKWAGIAIGGISQPAAPSSGGVWFGGGSTSGLGGGGAGGYTGALFIAPPPSGGPPSGGNQTSIVVNVNTSTGETSSKSKAQGASDLGRQIEDAVNAVIIKNQRQGGLLARTA
jgi:hypothetical protein